MAPAYKRVSILLLSVVTLGCGWRGHSHYVAKAARVKGPVLIDGMADSCWNKTDWQDITEFVYDKQLAPRSIAARFKVLWDRTNCYFLFDVTDDIKYRRDIPANSEEAQLDFFDHLSENDCVLLYFFNPGYVYGEGHDVYLYRLVYDYKEVTFDYATDSKWKSRIKLAQHDSPEGYSMEVSIPWVSMDLNPSAGDRVGFKAQVVDNDDISIGPGIPAFSESALSWSGADATASPYYGQIDLQP